MIKVNDIAGTVTMSLSDYEKFRDRSDKAVKDLKEEKNKFEEEKLKFHNSCKIIYQKYEGHSLYKDYGLPEIIDVKYISNDEALIQLKQKTDILMKQKVEEAINSERKRWKYLSVKEFKQKKNGRE